ncbi:MAG: hypothetical protein HQL95_01430 [Magnetococcales bacterium]|nr:hypothetical protein [Magnetococcales bacterium]
MKRIRVLRVVLVIMMWVLSTAGAQAITLGSSMSNVTSTSHSVSTSSTNSSVAFSWSAETVNTTGDSITYEYVLSTDSTLDNTTFESRLAATASTTLARGTLTNTTSVTASSMADGTYYFYIRAWEKGVTVDGTKLTKAGPYILNSAPSLDATTPITPTSGSHKSAVTVTINGSNFMNGATVKLVNGTRSGTTLTDVSLTNVTVASASQITASVPASTAPGVYSVQVTNSTPWSKTATAVGKYTSTNTAPVAATGGDQTVTLSSSGSVTVSLSGATSSDADGDTLASYTWTLTSMPTSATITSGSAALSTNSTLSGSAQSVVVKTAGTYTFTLLVNDGFENSATSSMTLTVKAASGSNNAPTANPGSDVTVVPGNAATLNGSLSSDPDAGDSITSYIWTLTSKPAASALATGTAGTQSSFITQQSTSSPTASFTPDKAGKYVIALIVKDSSSTASTAKSVTVTANNAPVAKAGSAQTVAKGDLVTLDGSGSVDADSDTLTYSWSQSSPTTPVVTLSSVTAAKPTFTPTVAGTYVFKLEVNDGTQKSTNTDNTVTITVNTRPVANAGSAQVVSPGATVTLDGSGSTDAENSALTYTWSQTGTTVTLSSTSASKPTFTAPSTSGALVFSLSVSDGVHSSATAATVTVTVNNTPVASAGTAQTVTTAGVVTLKGSATDQDTADVAGLTYTWSLVSQPTGSSITLSSASAKEPTFTPTVNGTYTFSLVVGDGKSNSTPSTVTVTYSGNTTSKLADVDKDDNLNATDGVLLLRTLSGAATITTGLTIAADQNDTIKARVTAAGTALDVDKNGTVNATDGVLILRYLSGAATITTGLSLTTDETTIKNAIDLLMK